MSLYPLLLEPALHTRVWGGRRLQTQLNKTLPTDEPYGESWELHDTAKIVNGEHTGKTIGELLSEYGTDLIGEHSDPAQGFPLLAKFLDAAEWLSIQVHPNNQQALELEGESRGKTEAWVILTADPGSRLVIGVRQGTDRDMIEQAIRDNSLEDLLVYVNVKPGDVLYIAAGTIHAIGGGILLYEIQQSSDITYRFYDWGRMGLDGKPRPLHVEKSLKVSNIATLPHVAHPIGDGEPIVAGEYFTTYRHTLNGNSLNLDTEGQFFHALTCIAGEVEAVTGSMTVPMHTGQTILIPTKLGTYSLHGSGQVLRSQQK
jgi:mannose-6-phosphate isomerase